jgi:hypothetical protein
MQRGKKVAAVAAAGACVLAGAAAGISQSAASSSSSSSSAKAGKAGAHARLAGAHGFGFGHGPGGEVHAVEVVPNKAGTGFVTVTEDNGTITAVDSGAGTITLKEGTSSATYATPTITIPSGATVTLDGATSSLEKLKAGDHVSISSSSEGTTVFAVDSSFQPGNRPGPGMMGGSAPQGGMPQGGAPPTQSY